MTTNDAIDIAFARQVRDCIFKTTDVADSIFTFNFKYAASDQ